MVLLPQAPVAMEPGRDADAARLGMLMMLGRE